MPRKSVHVEGHIAATPAVVWATARDFCGAWHPAIDTIAAERDARGALIRRFTVRGEKTTYREQLIYFSDSDRTLAYAHLEGIRGADSYAGRLSVSPADSGGSLVTWTADVLAAGDRADEIAAGTRFVFDAGIGGLAAACGRPAPASMDATSPSGLDAETLLLEGAPRIALDVTPPKRGPLCLFLHGIGGGRGNWKTQLAAVQPVMRAAAMDLRGYGDSALGSAGSTVVDYCDDILRVLDRLDAPRVVLCGLSYGSWIATTFALRHPRRTAGLVLSGGCTGMSEASADQREAFRRSRLAPLDEGLAPADFGPAVVESIVGPDASAETCSRLIASMSAIPVATYRDAVQCFTNPRERFDFSRLSMPVLMMTGEHDRLAPPAEIRGVARRIAETASFPSVRFELIAGAGHICNIEAPAAYNRVLVEFLRELPQ